MAVDTTTSAGEAMAHMLATFAQFDRRLIGQRTRDALVIKREQGVRLGRPPALHDEVRSRIRAGRSTTGASYAVIAALLNAQGVPTAHGAATWSPATVRAVINAAE